jgi:ATP-binding cassette subfamily C (CFTR/MRP) protein 1
VGPFACFVIFSIQASAEGSSGLSPSKAFSSLAIISLLTAPAEDFLLSLPSIAMSAGCLERIQSFLLSDSVAKRMMTTHTPEDTSSITELSGAVELQELNGKPLDGLMVMLENASIGPSSSAPVLLRNIDLQISKGSLTMVIGIVGSGKSTLLKAIIGELGCAEGSITNNARDMAYCSQTAWLQNTTVKGIVCGPINANEIDERWYHSVLHACAFDEDVMTLPDQHDTIIGSRGVTLSGGQKQRLVSYFATLFSICTHRSRHWLELFMRDEILSYLMMFSVLSMAGLRLLLLIGYLERLGCSEVIGRPSYSQLILVSDIGAEQKDNLLTSCSQTSLASG